MSLQPMVTLVGQAVPLQPIEVHSGEKIHLQLMENPTLSGWMCLENTSQRPLGTSTRKPVLEWVCWQDL